MFVGVVVLHGSTPSKGNVVAGVVMMVVAVVVCVGVVVEVVVVVMEVDSELSAATEAVAELLGSVPDLRQNGLLAVGRAMARADLMLTACSGARRRI